MRTLQPETPASVLAFVTTLHVALAVLRKHRTCPTGFPKLILLPSLLFCAAPWVLPEPNWLAAVFAAHFVWFLVCEKFASPQLPAKSAARPEPPPRPVAAPILAAPPAGFGKKGFSSVPVLAVLQETPDIKTFRLARPEGLAFSAGQSLG